MNVCCHGIERLRTTKNRPRQSERAWVILEGMQTNDLELLARQLLDGKLALAEFLRRAMDESGIADVAEAQVDTDRLRRCGFPEVIYGPGKSFDTLVKVICALENRRQPVLVTRLTADFGLCLAKEFPSGVFNDVANTFRMDAPSSQTELAPPLPAGRIVLVTAGTSDLPVAEEARETLLWMGFHPVVIKDVGVAGPHRLVSKLDQLVGCDAVVVVAGMEGALPSVVGGYVDCPVIGVPTSVGYGANFGGLSALLGMLNSCAANVTVVNIDAGFKGAYIAGLITHRAHTTDRA